MHLTIFNTPVIQSIFRGISLFFLKLLGWRTVGSLPKENRYIIVVAPHTSNWDLFYGIIVAFAFRLDAYFMAKNQLFRWPFGPVMKWIGGVPIDRSHAGNTVDQVVRAFKENERFVLAIAPEGTRKRTSHWKTGFYRIAEGARVPVLLGFLDYASKTGGAGPLITTTGDIEKDMRVIREFYQTVTPRYVDKAGTAVITDRDIAT
ncbi:MAG: lysophospholipid acyltransferase family protein [Spirochaetes bacterium]|nr:lysophospholipid acyltransferase family protein [Spirochaetota bacterium]